MPQLSILQYGAAVLIAILGVISALSLNSDEQAAIFLSPTTGNWVVGETFAIDVMAKTNTPANVFGGLIEFDSNYIEVVSISYNTSITDLWAEEPWYQNGAGTIGFIGGTTKKGGFLGTDKLMTINFKSKKQGDVNVHLINTRVLLHDGLGTDAVLASSIENIYYIKDDVVEVLNNNPTATISNLTFLETYSKTDLNQDGKTSIADISIFVKDLATKNLRSDFNDDLKVNTTDLNILLEEI